MAKNSQLQVRSRLWSCAPTLILLNLLGAAPAFSRPTSSTPVPPVLSIYQPYQFSTFAGNGPGSIDGQGRAARFDGPFGTAVDHEGNIYVADGNNNSIRKITPGGLVSTLAGLAGVEGSVDGTGSAARFFGPKGVAVDDSGNVYVADSGNHTIRKITPTGIVSLVAGMAGIPGCSGGTGTAARFHFPTGIAVDENGILYVADNVNNTIRKITTDGDVTTLAGTPGVSGSTDGVGAAALFSGPFGIAVDSSGNLFVTDSRNYAIRKIGTDALVSTFAGLVGQQGSADSPESPQFGGPLGITVDSAGNVFVADGLNQTIRKITSSGIVSTLAGTASEEVGGGGNVDGIGALAQFNRPTGIAVDSGGVLYVGDSQNNTIRKITPDAFVTTFAGVSGLGTKNGLGSAARFEFPNGIALDTAGNVYVADVANDTIRKITPAGLVSTLAGSPGIPGYVNGKGSAAQFNFPRGVAVDGNGNVYVSDRLNQSIRKITPDGVVSTLAGPTPGPSPLPSGNTNGAGSEARFNEPFGIAVDKSGNVFVADSNNNLIRTVNPSGVVDSLPPNRSVNRPGGMAIDSQGNLYVTTSPVIDPVLNKVGDVILKITPAGAVTTVAGGSRGSFDGPASFAQFRQPSGVAVDGAGNIFVADTNNNTVRKIGTDAFVTTVGGSVGRRGGADGIGRAARFFLPRGLAVDGLGRLFVADNVNNTIRVGVAAAPVITSPTTASGTVGLEFAYQFAADGTTAVTIGTNLPPGLKPDLEHSAIVGTPTAAGTFTVPLVASNSIGTTKSSLTITIQPASTLDMNIVSGSGLTGRSGRLFSYRVKGSGLSLSATISASGLPPGLTIDQTGLISGVLSDQVVTDPTADVVTTAPVPDGSSAVKLVVNDGGGMLESTLQLTFTSDPAVPVIISPTQANVADGRPFSYAIATPTPDPSATPDPTAGVTTYAIAGTPPPGLTFNAATGTISGIYNQQAEKKGATRTWKGLSGGAPNIAGSVQLFAKNRRGTATIPLLFLKAPPRADNLSTRVPVGTNDNVLIGGFIINGTAPGQVLVRGLGPSLNVDGVPIAGALQNPSLEIHDSKGGLIAKNDNWGNSCEAPDIFATGLAPPDPQESAILLSLSPGNYTTILRGSGNSTGIGLVEVYDLGTASSDVSSESHLANISTRGTVQAGDEVMIGGFIIGGNTTSNVLVRALGPSLVNQGIAGALADPVLELHDRDGALIAANDDWTGDQEAQILFTNLAPSNSHESAILQNLNPGTYSATVSGKNGLGGVALVEVYVLPP